MPACVPPSVISTPTSVYKFSRTQAPGSECRWHKADRKSGPMKRTHTTQQNTTLPAPNCVPHERRENSQDEREQAGMCRVEHGHGCQLAMADLAARKADFNQTSYFGSEKTLRQKINSQTHIKEDYTVRNGIPLSIDDYLFVINRKYEAKVSSKEN